MTKEEIINIILNFNIIKVCDVKDTILFSTSLVGYKADVLFVCSKGVGIIYNTANQEGMYHIVPFEQIKRITYLTEKTIE